MNLQRGRWIVVIVLALAISTGCNDQSNAPASLKRRAPVTTAPDSPDVILQKANDAARSGDFRRVESLLRPLLITDPGNVRAIYLVAQAQATQKNFQQAVRTLDSIPPDDQDLGIVALSQAADWLIRLRQYDEAEQRLRRMIAAKPDSVSAHRRLAQLLNNQARRIEAAGHLRALAKMGAATEAELYGMTTFGDPFNHRPIEPTSVEVEPNRLADAKNDWYLGEFEKAQSSVEELQNADPDSTTVSAFLGRIYAQRGDDTNFSKWLDSTPVGIEREPEYWWALGIWHQRRDDHDVAVRCFAEAVLRDDTDRFSYLGMARSLEVTGRRSEAAAMMKRFELLEEVYNVATEIDRTPAQLNRMVQALIQLRRFDEARAWREIAMRTSVAGEDIPSQIPPSTAQLPTDATWITCGLVPSNWPLPGDLDVDLSTTKFDQQDDSPGGPIVMKNVAAQVGLKMRYMPGPAGTDVDDLQFHQTVGGGVAVLDFDLDGWVDLYFTQSGGPAFEQAASESNRMYRNIAGKFFADVSEASATNDRHYGQGVSAGDVNQDGFVDLIVANIGPNVLLINNGDGTFERRPLSASDDPGRWTTSIACADVSGDHLPDVLEVNYIDDPAAMRAICSEKGGGARCNPQNFRPASDRILRNLGDGNWESWNADLLEQTPGYGFSAIITNFDDQFGNDVFIANDTDPNHYWVSQSGSPSASTFSLVQRGQLLGCAMGLSGNPQSCMGIAGGDFDRNGWIDLHVTNYTDESSDLYLQRDSGIFDNAFVGYGLERATRPMVGWGTQTADFNCDGWLDLAAVNGHLYSRLSDHPYRMPPQLFQGSRSGFAVVDPSAEGDPFWTRPSLGRTLASLDWNRDGKPDLVAYDLDDPAVLLENHSEVGNWLALQLVGTTSERAAVGAKVIVDGGKEQWTGWVTAGDGYLCSNEPVLHFGIGSSEAIESVTVNWPSGQTERLKKIQPNRRYWIVEGQPPFAAQ